MTHLVFHFGAGQLVAGKPTARAKSWPDDSWQELVKRSGVAPRSLAQVQQGLDTGDYDEGYIRFVVATIRLRVAAGHVRKEGGAVYKAITDKQLWAAYCKPLRRPARKLDSRNAGLH